MDQSYAAEWLPDRRKAWIMSRILFIRPRDAYKPRVLEATLVILIIVVFDDDQEFQNEQCY